MPNLRERFHALISYEPNSGCWIWTGAQGNKGYGRFWLNGKLQQAHRVAWEIVNGPIPETMQLDHKCRNRACCNPEHLRLASNTENCINRLKRRNCTNPLKGVSWHKNTGKWQAQIQINGKETYLGVFENPEDAHAAYVEAANKWHGEFACAG